MTDHPAPPLTPLEEQLDALLLKEIEAQDARRQTPDGSSDDLDDFRRSTMTIRQEADLRKALRRLCLAVEEKLDGEQSCDLQDHYEAARAALGEPCTEFPGGPDGHHFHFLDFDPEAECCYYCDQHAQAQEEADAPATC
jgi:hypothetical protein